VSHELRTPLTPIMGYLSLFQSHGDRLPPAKREKCLEIMTERTAHMARLIDDVLLASRIGSDEERGIEGISLARENIVELIERAAVVDANRVRLELPGASAYVCCDATRAVQVLTNLISNGLKYSPAEAPVTVRLQQENAEEVVVEVVDEGRGIPIEEQQRIFEKFHRVEDPLTMTTSGTGLGLYIARRLARAMNGDVTVESAPGAGSTFGLRLPTTGPAQPMASQADTPALPRPRWEKRIERVTQRSTRSDQALHEN
jgi:signal transduction histidine kinase